MQLGHLDKLEVEEDTENLESDIELLTTHTRNTSRTRVTEEDAEHLKALRQIKNALSRGFRITPVLAAPDPPG